MSRVSSRHNKNSRNSRIFIPQSRYDPQYRIFIKWNGEDWSDVTEHVFKITVAKRATDAIDYFSLGVSDLSYMFKNKVQGGEWVAIYLGYGFANERMITARLEKWSWSYQPLTGMTIKEIRGRAWPEIKDKQVSLTFKRRNVEDAIADVVAKYGELTFTPTGISTEVISANYQRMPGLSIIKDICKRFGLDWYIDALGVVYVTDKTKESSKITDEALTIQQNITAIENFEVNTATVKNRVSVNGQQDNYVTYLRTVNDEDSQDQFWVKDKAIFDSAVASHEELNDRADQELFIHNNDKKTIRLASLGMVKARPGKRIFLSAPPLDENWHLIKSCSHTIDEQGYKTSYTLNNSVNNASKMAVERTKNERELRPSSLEKVYDDCLVFDFKDTTEYNFTNCTIENGFLTITDSTLASSCSFLTDVPGLTTDVKTRSAFVQLSGQDYENVKVKVSNDEGLNYSTFEGSSLNTDEIQFTSLDDTHRVDIELYNGAEGSVTPVKLNRIGVYLEHDADSIPVVTVPALSYSESSFYTDDQFTFTEYVRNTDYYDSTNSSDVTWDTTNHKITIQDTFYTNKITINNSDFTKMLLELNPSTIEDVELFVSFDEKATWTQITADVKTDIPVSTYTSVYIKITAVPQTFGTTGLSFPILFSANSELQGKTTIGDPLINPAIKLSLTKS